MSATVAHDPLCVYRACDEAGSESMLKQLVALGAPSDAGNPDRAGAHDGRASTLSVDVLALLHLDTDQSNRVFRKLTARSGAATIMR